MLIRPGLVLLTLVTLAAGCGSSGDGKPVPPDASVRTTVERFYAAYGRGDGRSACALLTASAQTAYAQEAGAIADGIPCAELVESYSSQLVDATPEVKDIRVNGDTATANVDLGESQIAQRVTLTRSGSSWKISDSVDAPAP